ncbi:NTP transferase domain-containing protein [Desulfolutivibrio sulfoxidireducens]|nr:NTP transferase domain-containing protein [Desulfolutivibrio sulfoxidireducens]
MMSIIAVPIGEVVAAGTLQSSFRGATCFETSSRFLGRAMNNRSVQNEHISSDMDKYCISETDSMLFALAKLNKAGSRVLLVVNDHKKLVGIITDGDIRRELLRKRDIEIKVSEFMNTRFTALHVSQRHRAEEIIMKGKFQEVPILDDAGVVLDLVTLASLHREAKHAKALPVVIMAGGKGSRLTPLTSVIPKPLVPVGESTMIELIITYFRSQGFKDFYIIVNYMKELIKSYFYENSLMDGISFVDEDEFMGTAGGLRLLPESVGERFLLTNCDVLVKTDMNKLIQAHAAEDAELTILGINRVMDIPYGVIGLDAESNVISVEEKPTYSYVVISGVYMLSGSILEHIPANQDFGMDKLIAALLEKGKKVHCHVTSDEWLDMGQFKEYRKLLQHLGVFL